MASFNRLPRTKPPGESRHHRQGADIENADDLSIMSSNSIASKAALIKSKFTSGWKRVDDDGTSVSVGEQQAQQRTGRMDTPVLAEVGAMR